MTRNNQLSEELKYTGDSRTPTHLRLCCYDADTLYTEDACTPESLLPHLKEDRNIWLQIHGFRDTETIGQVCHLFGIGFLTVQDILNTEHLTKIEEHEAYNVVILKQLYPEPGTKDYRSMQLAIVQGEHFLLTFAESETGSLNDIRTALEKNTLRIRNRHSDFLLCVILNSIITRFMSFISAIEDGLEDLEERVLAPQPDDNTGIEAIQQYRRDFRLVRKCILPLKEQMGKLLYTENGLLHEANRPFFNDLNDHVQFVTYTLNECRDMISSLVEICLSNNDRRMNGIMKQLTVVSTIFIPLTFLAGIWGMNFRLMPELDWRYGYLFAWAVMLVTGIGAYFYFKRKRWY